MSCKINTLCYKTAFNEQQFPEQIEILMKNMNIQVNQAVVSEGS